MAVITGVISEVFIESGAAFDDVPPEQLAELVRRRTAGGRCTSPVAAARAGGARGVPGPP
jgi:hypothetical protein